MTSSNKANLRPLSYDGVKWGIYDKNLTNSCPHCSTTAMATEGLWTRSLTSRQWVTSWWGTLPLPAFLFVFLLFSFIGVSGDQLSTFWWWKAPVQRTPPGEPLGNLRRPWACPLHGHWLLWCWTNWTFPLIILIFHVWLVVVDPYFIHHQEFFEKTIWICLENTKLFHRCVVLAPFT